MSPVRLLNFSARDEKIFLFVLTKNDLKILFEESLTG